MSDQLKKNILIYNGQGVSDSVSVIAEMLKRTVDLSLCSILMVDADYLKTAEDWESQACLFIMPGGRARPYYEALGAVWEKADVAPGEIRRLKSTGLGNERIKDFVEKGGRYLGICAGAYYAASITVFESGSDLEVLDEGALCFFSGVAEGPAYGLKKFLYNSERGAEISHLKSDQLIYGNVSAYFNGGCFFEGDDTQVLLRYDDLKSKPVAMIENKVGEGSAILSGIHFEMLSEDVSMTEALKIDDEQRVLLAAEILDRLGVPLSKKISEKMYVKQKTELLLPDEMCVKDPVFKREHFICIDSTQAYAVDHARDLSLNEWRVVTADTQTAGKGTRERTWLSPTGNLYATFSTLLPKSVNANNLSTIPHVVGLSIIQLLKTFGVSAQLKWVNDVLVNKKKIAGVLSQLSVRPTGQIALHIGVGLNLNLSQGQTDALPQAATSMMLELGQKVELSTVLSLLKTSLAAHVDCLLRNGYAFFHSRVEGLLAFQGEKIDFDTEGKQGVLKVTLKGVNEHGALLLEDASGELSAHINGRILLDKKA